MANTTATTASGWSCSWGGGGGGAGYVPFSSHGANGGGGLYTQSSSQLVVGCLSQLSVGLLSSSFSSQSASLPSSHDAVQGSCC